MRLALVLTLTAFALATSDARAFEAPRDDATLPDLTIATDEEIAIPELVMMWSRRFDALAVIDPALSGSTVHFVTPVTTLTWGTMKAILDAHGAAVLESQPAVDGPWVLRVYSRARLANRPFAAAAEAANGQVVAAVFSIAHGAGQRIFAALCQNVSEGRSSHRLGAVFYVPGPEQIVVVDRPTTVRVLGELIETLDFDGPPRDLEPRRLVIESEVWEVGAPTDLLSIGVELAALSRGAAGAIGLGLSWPQGSRDASRLSAIVDRDTLDRVPLLLQEIAAFDEARLVTKPFVITDENTPVTFSLSNRGCFFGSINMVPPPSAEDAAHTLLLAPRVCPGDDVALDASLNLARGADARTSTASVTVPNGRYAVFGLELETERTVEDRVPILGDLPLLGPAFRSWSRRVSRARVYIFVRPTLLAPTGPATSTRRGHSAERAAWLPSSVPERP